MSSQRNSASVCMIALSSSRMRASSLRGVGGVAAGGQVVQLLE